MLWPNTMKAFSFVYWSSVYFCKYSSYDCNLYWENRWKKKIWWSLSLSLSLTYTHTHTNGLRQTHNRPMRDPFQLHFTRLGVLGRLTLVTVSKSLTLIPNIPQPGSLSYVMASQSCEFNKRRLLPTHIPRRFNHMTLTKEDSSPQKIPRRFNHMTLTKEDSSPHTFHEGSITWL